MRLLSLLLMKAYFKISTAHARGYMLDASQLININMYFLLTLSKRSRLFSCENKALDLHSKLSKIKIKVLAKCLQGNY